MKLDESFQLAGDRKVDGVNITLPLWALWPIIVTFMGATAYFLNTLNRVDNKLDTLSSDRWTRLHEREFGNRLQHDNPELKVPNSDQIVKDLQ